MAKAILVLIFSFVVIMFGCGLFTNGIEWFGRKRRLGEGVVGSVLAAVATALPETMIAVVAIAFYRGEEHGAEVAIGAILGAPFLLSTLAFLVIATSVFVYTARGRRTHDMPVNDAVLSRDLGSFFIVYLIACSLAYLPPEWKAPALRVSAAAVLVLIYALYLRKHFVDQGRVEDAEDLKPLMFDVHQEDPRLGRVIVQCVASLIMIIGGAHAFVEQITFVSTTVGVSAATLSLIIAPIVSELPEKFNSIFWTRDGKDTLALGNVTGAMVFQSSITPAIGILFTEWTFAGRPGLTTSVVVALVSAAFVFTSLKVKRRLSPYVLLVGAPLYLVFALDVFVFHWSG